MGVGRSPRVYPRVCGGTVYAQTLDIEGRGLSPRVRGNLGLGHVALGDEGSIPACAGEPAFGLESVGQQRVYPRVCGGT